MKGPSCSVGSVMRVQVKNCVMLPIILDSSPLPPVVVCLCLKLTFFTMLIDISEYKLSVFIKCMMGSPFSIYVLTLLVSELNWIIYPICVRFFIHFGWLNDYSAEAGSELTLTTEQSQLWGSDQVPAARHQHFFFVPRFSWVNQLFPRPEPHFPYLSFIYGFINWHGWLSMASWTRWLRWYIMNISAQPPGRATQRIKPQTCSEIALLEHLFLW